MINQNGINSECPGEDQPRMFVQKGRRSNLPCEDFAETRQLLKDEREKNEILRRVNKRLVESNKALTDMIEDILDDRGLPHA